MNYAASALKVPAQQAGRRPAPPIAAKNAEAARLNIKAKHDLLHDYLSQATGDLRQAVMPIAALRLTDLPQSVRQFNNWESASLREDIRSLFAPFFRNSNATLKKHTDLHRQVDERIRALGNGMTPSTAKEASRAGLLRQLSLANRLRQICERELIRARRELADERSKIDGLEGEVASTAAKFKEEMKGLKSRNMKLQAENNRLDALLKSSANLRSV